MQVALHSEITFIGVAKISYRQGSYVLKVAWIITDIFALEVETAYVWSSIVNLSNIII